MQARCVKTSEALAKLMYVDLAVLFEAFPLKCC